MNATIINPPILPPPPPLSTLTPLPPLIPPITDAVLLLVSPVVAYWCLSMIFHFMDSYDLLSKYRLHTPAEVLKRNHVSRGEVMRDVILQQIIQSVVGWVISLSEGIEMRGGEWWEILNLYSKFLQTERWVTGVLQMVGINTAGLEQKVIAGITAIGGDNLLEGAVQFMGLEPTDNGNWRYKLVEIAYWYIFPAARMWFAIFVLDTWQYFLHRLMHESKWLYKTFHSRHHRLYVPYAFGALYNHPFEGLLMDTLGAGIAFKMSGLKVRGGVFFFTFSTMKTVDDHCGYSLPFDPLQYIFWNNASYHDIHHQGWGIKTNFSQPFFICWDRWLGTQWTGGDVSSRYQASRERAATALSRDGLKDEMSKMTNGSSSSYANGSTNGYTNGGLKPRIPNGKPGMQAEESRRQILEDEGANVLYEEDREEREVEAQMERERRDRWNDGEAW
ncbi:uncharacterized protein H6S33_011934 [Morchella sextelata]|uniref:uncharacterized protein n=1 Tax=Morchella sextelata TaxID=1174677 RepID=UPI001D04FA19|nr:uncharacterized protein H6S33_011934 [Morchella sextelata]KAH0610407.1 hypothetical protein H6S33_011934 [Morchella sextelata]